MEKRLLETSRFKIPYVWVRTLVLLGIWIPCAIGLFKYIDRETEFKRFETLILSNGKVSSVQRESLFGQETALRTGDRILKVGGIPFDWLETKKLIHSLPKAKEIKAEILSRGEKKEVAMLVREYSRRDLLSLGILPAIVSIIFLFFSILTPFQRFDARKNQEAVEVFSVLCFGISLFFLGFFPGVTLGMSIAPSILNPILGVVLVHLFSVYPKKKSSFKIRLSVLSSAYVIAAALVVFRLLNWQARVPTWMDLLEFFWMGSGVIISMVCLGNTLFTSRDFWTLRRAKLLSFVLVLSFTAFVSVFVSFLWEGPRISLERMLAASLLFPTFFAFIFSKENVFDLERIFRRGIHQILFVGIAVTLSVLVGLGWQQWQENQEKDWMLWAAIAMVVAFLARPAGALFERIAARILSGKVKFPRVDDIFKESKSIEEFLGGLAEKCEKNLGMHSITFRIFKDPTLPWGSDNEQVWRMGHSRLHRLYEFRLRLPYSFPLLRGQLQVGEISFAGGDGLAFDPEITAEWPGFLRHLAGFLELLVLRDFLVSQQGLLAVGRMQALLAHEMKNPLAVIKVCSGLLQEHVGGSDEGEELLRTIQQEVNRVSQAVQNVFNHSGREENSLSVDLFELIENVKQGCLARFPNSVLDVRLQFDDVVQVWEKDCLWMWTQREGLRQSLNNLLINAFEAGSEWAELEIQFKSQQYLRIVVKDRGPGIPNSVELFKPFVSTKANGTGLGLSHVKSFVDRHSGRIQINSRMGEGTQVILEFSPQSAMKERQA